MWIKICGMTTDDAVAAALAAQVHAIGFVFAPSSRRVTPERAVQLAAPARGRVCLIAVTQHPSQQLVDDIVRTFKPDMLQTDVTDLDALRVPGGLGILPVMRSGAPMMHAQADESAARPLPGRLLFEGAMSGAGQRCDWSPARALARRAQLVLAGGLNSDNVADAIAQVGPFGVDVSSGVETRPGIKSAERIMRFAAAARAAGGANGPG